MAQGHSFETDAQGNLIGVPTNLKVDSAGNVFDGAGNFVGRAGEVYVDNDGNAVNAAGQIVGFATAGVRAPVSTGVAAPAHSNPGYPAHPAAAAPPVLQAPPVSYPQPVQAASVTPAPPVETPSGINSGYGGGVALQPVTEPHLAREAAEVLSRSEFYRNSEGGLLEVPTNLTVDHNGMVIDARGQVVGRAGEVFVDAYGNAINAAGQIVGSATAAIDPIILASHRSRYDTNGAVEADPRYQANTHYDSSNHYEGTVGYPNTADYADSADYGSNDGTEFAGRHFASHATEGLVPESSLDAVHEVAGYDTDSGYLDSHANYSDRLTYPAEPTYPVGYSESTAYSEPAVSITDQESHQARHIVSGETVPTNLFVDDDGNVTDAAGNYLGRAGEVVADAAGNILNSSGHVVGESTGPINYNDHTYDPSTEPSQDWN